MAGPKHQEGELTCIVCDHSPTVIQMQCTVYLCVYIIFDPVPTRGSIFLLISDCLGCVVLLCFVVCMALFASFLHLL